ncbi:MAG: glycosyltransferase family 39 protein [Candidatus Micrarchaeota archaeon]
MRKRIAILFILSLLIGILFMNQGPFVKDEALYAQTIDEMIATWNPLPTYGGDLAGWKPPAMYWVYSVFIAVLMGLGLPVEITYRLPGVLLGSLCSVLVYLVVRRGSGNEDLGFISGIAYAGNGLAIAVSLKLLMDTLLLTFILAGVLCYMKAVDDRRFALFGGLFVFMAILTKTIVGLIIPLLAIAYWVLHYRRTPLRWELFASFLTIPLAFLFLYAFMPGIGEQYQLDSMSRIPMNMKLGYYVGLNVIEILEFCMVWLALAVYGAYMYRNDDDMRFWYAWGLVALVPLIVAGPLFWYFLPLMPVVSVLAGKVVLSNGKVDALVIAFALGVMLLSLPGVYNYQSLVVDSQEKRDARDLGEHILGKDVLVIMEYNPTVLYYGLPKNGMHENIDALFMDHSALSDCELERLVVDSELPDGTLDVSGAFLLHFLHPSISFGEFEKQHEYIALDRDAYMERFLGNDGYSGFWVEHETESFVVIKRG